MPEKTTEKQPLPLSISISRAPSTPIRIDVDTFRLLAYVHAKDYYQSVSLTIPEHVVFNDQGERIYMMIMRPELKGVHELLARKNSILILNPKPKFSLTIAKDTVDGIEIVADNHERVYVDFDSFVSVRISEFFTVLWLWYRTYFKNEVDIHYILSEIRNKYTYIVAFI